MIFWLFIGTPLTPFATNGDPPLYIYRPAPSDPAGERFRKRREKLRVVRASLKCQAAGTSYPLEMEFPIESGGYAIAS